MSVCQYCGTCLTHGDECTNRGGCEFFVGRCAGATKEERLIADALAEFSRLNDVRKARAAR